MLCTYGHTDQDITIDSVPCNIPSILPLSYENDSSTDFSQITYTHLHGVVYSPFVNSHKKCIKGYISRNNSMQNVAFEPLVYKWSTMMLIEKRPERTCLWWRTSASSQQAHCNTEVCEVRLTGWFGVDVGARHSLRGLL